MIVEIVKVFFNFPETFLSTFIIVCFMLPLNFAITGVTDPAICATIRYPHIGKDHLVKLLKQLMLNTAPPLHGEVGGNAPSAVDVPTLLGTGSFSLLDCT